MAKKKKKKVKAKKKKILTFRMFISLLVVLAFTVMYVESAILLAIGMLPTFVAYFLDKDVGKNKTFTIGAMNFSGCVYYLANIWKSPLPADTLADYLSNPITIIVIYSAAALGYLINYAVTSFIASILRQKSKSRLKRLDEQKKKMEKRWGEKVSGLKDLDIHGFPIEQNEAH